MRKWLRLPLALVVLLTLLLGSINPVGAPVAQAVGTWTTTGSMATGRTDHTATLLPNGKVLVTGGSTGTSAELYNPATGTFSPTGSMSTDRSFHTATLLPNGKVLIAGGDNASGYLTALSSAELYDPATGTFSPTGNMGTDRMNHTATLLPNGKVLIVGRYDWTYQTTLATAELYDPATGTFSPTGSMGADRERHTATLLTNGKVLVAGGATGSGQTALAGAELYNPATGTFSPTGSLIAGRFNHAATLLASGKALVTGGVTDNAATALVSAELYDPNTGTFSATGTMATVRSLHSATLLTSGKVLVAGSLGGINPAELYDPNTGAFSATGTMALMRYRHTDTLLPNGCVLVTGGSANLGSGTQANQGKVAEIYAETTCGTGPDLSITKVGVVTGQTVTYTITVTNIGTVPAASPIQVNDSLPATPAGMQFGTVSGNCSGGSAGPIVCSDPNHPTPLAPGNSFASTIVLNVGAAGVAVSNCATVSQGSNAGTPADPDLSNNRACATNTVRPATPPSACVAPPSGMVGWWPGDNNPNDIVGTAHGTLMSGATYAAGKVASAFSLLGGSDYVNVPNSPQLNPGAGSFSVDAWIQTSAVGSLTDILDKRTRTANAAGANVYTGYALFVSQGVLGMQLADGGASGGFTNYISTSPVIADGQWHHVAATLDRPGTSGSPAIGRLIVDGVVALTFDPAGRSGSLTNTADLQIGRESFGGFNFQGLVDEVEFFNRALSVAEVASIYNAGGAGKCKVGTPPQPTQGTISGHKWRDDNGNGVIDAGEPGLPNVTICHLVYPGALPAGPCVATDSNGDYSFLVPPGGYVVSEQLISGYVNNTYIPTTSHYHLVTVAAGQVVTGVNFGNTTPVPPPAEVGVVGGPFQPVYGVPVVWMNQPVTITKNVVLHCGGVPPVQVRLIISIPVTGGPGASQMMTNTSGSIWSATFPSFSGQHGPAFLTFYVDCPPDTAGFPESLTDADSSGLPDLMGPEDEIQIGGMIYIDPSGTVVNDATGAPIAGATVTLLKETPAGSGAYTTPAAAEAIPSMNPQTTGASGAYGWVVVPGRWKVRAAASGCTTVESAPMDIPPAVTDLTLRLTCQSAGGGSPVLTGPADKSVQSLGPLLQWTNPAGTTQYQIQVIPFGNDGPGINLIRNAETSFQVAAPVFGQGNYVMLPGMTYTWRVRTTQAATAVDENDPSWGSWTSRTFMTATPSSASIRLVSPAAGSTIFDRWGNLIWDDTDIVHFYYEVQVSKDPSFNTDPKTAIASVYWNLIHGGQTMPRNSYTIPTNAPLELDSTYFWHVRPRVQGDGTPVAWSTTWTFRTP